MGNTERYLSRDIFWQDVRQEQVKGLLSPRFYPHPSEFHMEPEDWPEIMEFMTRQMRELDTLTARLGSGAHWAGSSSQIAIADVNGKVQLHVCDTGVHIVVYVTEPGASGQETIVIVPVTRVERVVPESVAEVAGVPAECREEVTNRVAETASLCKSGSLVFSLNPFSFTWGWRSGASLDCRPMLVRAILRWAMSRDGVSLPDLANGRYARSFEECALYKKRDRPVYRFCVRLPTWGCQFSNAFVEILRDIGYTVVDHPFWNFEGSDSGEWFASKNKDQLDEIIRLLGEQSEFNDFAMEARVKQKLQELPDVVNGSFHEIDFKPKRISAYLSKAFGLKIRWVEGGHMGGQDSFYQFLIEA